MALSLASCPGKKARDGHAESSPERGPDPGGPGSASGADPAPPAPPAPQGLHAALDAYDRGRFGEAAERFEQLEGQVGPLEDYRLWWLAESLSLAGEAQESIPVWEALEKRKGSRFQPIAPFRRADALLQSGDPDGAAEAYASAAGEGVPASVDSASVYLNWGRALVASGRPEVARKRLEYVIEQYPHRPQAAQAREEILAVDPGWRQSAEERIAVAERLMELKRWKAAQEQLEDLGGDLSKQRAREVALMYADCVYNERRRWAEAQALYEKLARGKDPVASKSTYMVARCLHKRGLNKKASQAYRKFLDRFGGSTLRDDALKHLVVIDWEAGRWKKVRERGLPLLRAGTWSGDSRASALWMVAFATYLEGRLPQARGLMDEYEKQATESTSRARGLYWGGVIREAMGSMDQAAERYRQVARRHPLHYYGLLAMRRLEDMGEPVPDPADIVGEPGPRPGSGDCEGLPPVVASLMDLGLEYDARQEMKRRHRELIARHGDDLETLERLYSCAGATKLLVQHGNSGWKDAGAASPERVERWRLLYPVPYLALASEHGAEEGVPGLLALSIIRQESLFDPDAVSRTRACGLMQLMPATARAVAADLGEPWSEQALFVEETNIRFGTHYLGGLIRRFPDNYPAAIASYNGGPHNVSRWLAAHAPLPGDVFVELIPFGQTRNYVRRVITTWARYTWLETGSWQECTRWIPETMTGELGEGPGY